MDEWEQRWEIFDRMMESLRVRDARLSARLDALSVTGERLHTEINRIAESVDSLRAYTQDAVERMLVIAEDIAAVALSLDERLPPGAA